MDQSILKTQLPALVANHLPKNARRFKYIIYDGEPKQGFLGILVDPKPFVGNVVAVTESAIIIKTSRIEFAVVAKDLASHQFPIGTKVNVTPYARRNFDGTRIDTPKEEARQTMDGVSYTTRTIKLGGETTRLPVPTPNCPQLVELIKQLEELPAPDRFRRIANLLVDANARDFSCVDPHGNDDSAPALRFCVNTAKFQGQVTVLYEYGRDLYAVELHRDGVQVERVDDVYFDMLGSVLEGLIDDGNWRRILIEPVAKPDSRLH